MGTAREGTAGFRPRTPPPLGPPKQPHPPSRLGVTLTTGQGSESGTGGSRRWGGLGDMGPEAHRASTQPRGGRNQNRAQCDRGRRTEEGLTPAETAPRPPPPAGLEGQRTQGAESISLSDRLKRRVRSCGDRGGCRPPGYWGLQAGATAGP